MASQYELSNSVGASKPNGNTGIGKKASTMSDVSTRGSTNVRQRDRSSPPTGTTPGLTPSSSVGSFTSTDERRPLVAKFFDLTRSLSTTGWDEDGGEGGPHGKNSRRILGWLGGVFASVALGQLSTNAFLRVGEYCLYFVKYSRNLSDI